MRRRLFVARSGLFAAAIIAFANGHGHWRSASAAPLDRNAAAPHTSLQSNLRFAQATPNIDQPPVGGGNDQGPAPKLGEFVLYAQRTIVLIADEKVDGNIGVHAAALGVTGSQLRVGSSSTISKLLIAPSVDVAKGVTFAGALTNQLMQAGSPAAAQPFPAIAMPALPYLQVPEKAGTNAVNVPAGSAVTLGPGSYGALTVAQSGALRLLPGGYVFSQVTLGASTRLLAEIDTAPGKTSVTIRVLGKFTAASGVLIEPTNTQNKPVSAGHLTIFVYGSDARTDISVGANEAGASIGSHSKITALLAAPHGTLFVDTGVNATGAFAAYDITVQENTTIAFQDGFPDALAEQSGSQKLQGYLPSHPNSWPVSGPVPLDTQMTLAIGLPVRAPSGFPTLPDFIKQVSDPKQPATFRHFLTQTDFKTRYGATDPDYTALRTWAASNGFTTKPFSNNLLLGVTATAGQFERAFHLFLLFRQRADGSSFVSVDRDPSLDLSVPVLEIGGLTSFVVAGPSVTVNGTGVAGNGQPSSYRPPDLLAAYLSGPSAACSSLTGQGQVVGLVEFAVFSTSDVQAFDSRNNINFASNPPIVPVTEGGNPVSGSQAEATLDVTMVQSLAPAAQILVFQGSTGITHHLDDIYHAMATSNPPLTVASSSLTFKASHNAQQALDQLAAQGTSFFQASGDYGDIGDPQDNTRMGAQTLVGGTSLSTNALTASVPPYPSPYYNGETAWNLGQSKQKDATGGGIMDGNVKKGVCFFCAGQVDIPDYQVATQQQAAASNRGSTTARNYPDVAWIADNVEQFQGGTKGVSNGTSVSAPLWAGFIALANQQQAANGFGNTMGFLNPTLYDIGQTSGTADDLYAATFNDIKSGTNANGFGPGFSAVAGYDLVSGWGTPTCNLLTQLASPAPLTDTTPLVELEFIIGTGDDDLRNHSVLTADILLPDGITHLTTTLHPDNSGDWQNYDADNGGKPRTIGGIKVNKTVKMQITRQNMIQSVTLTLTQVSCLGCTSENWDMTSLTVNAYSGNSQRVCQINLSGNSKLDDGSTGLFRFKEHFDPDCSTGLCGPNHTFPTGGCP
jgi:hypothetical protein